MNFLTPFLKKQTKSDVVSVPVPDLKQYLVQEFEKARDRELIIEGLQQQLEAAEIVEQKYGAVLVTLEDYQRRLDDAETKATKEKERYRSLRPRI